MTRSIFIARLLGPVFVIAGIAVLTRPRAFRTIIGEFIQNSVLPYMSGVLGLVGGLAIVLTHDVWSTDWRVLITLIGWIMVLRALATILAPQHIVGVGNWLVRHRSALFAGGLLAVALGAVLSYFGYSA